MALIAEVKKASPSQGVIRPNFNPIQIAKLYQVAGAHCVSVLTDEPNFGGTLEYLRLCREAIDLPSLRKDFIFDPYQVVEARAYGADAILLIVAMLEETQLCELAASARELGMDVLVEVHDEPEAEVALRCKADLVGVNNRNLNDLSTDLAVSERVLPLVRESAVAISESAIETLEDIQRVEQAGAKGVLVGTTFCSAPDIVAKVKEVMGWR